MVPGASGVELCPLLVRHSDTVGFESPLPEVIQLPRQQLDAEGAATQITRLTETQSSVEWSPDGKTIAFSAQYDGNTDVFVVPVTGTPNTTYSVQRSTSLSGGGGTIGQAPTSGTASTSTAESGSGW
mgnify:CR=1 FL=1